MIIDMLRLDNTFLQYLNTDIYMYLPNAFSSNFN